MVSYVLNKTIHKVHLVDCAHRNSVIQSMTIHFKALVMWYSQKIVKFKKYSVLILTVAHSSHEAPNPIMSGLAFLEQG